MEECWMLILLLLVLAEDHLQHFLKAKSKKRNMESRNTVPVVLNSFCWCSALILCFSSSKEHIRIIVTTYFSNDVSHYIKLS
ncbi:tubby-like F-box protein 5 [Iris pallida]|uniref:Tubby-like F-box protein 5 n=1 Tax=Iris pallida TaxID=29817 RepID=A0AAX6GB73_IRIPA|nr:tubby-like F-box protein 5 [Iris pallida]